MPATEKTWYDQKLLHVVFGCTGLLMLISTVGMLVADHQREWKGYQRIMRGIDQKLTAWRLRAETSGQQQQLVDELQRAYATARIAPPSQEILNEFKDAIAAQASAGSVDRELSKIQDAYDELRLADGQGEAEALRGTLLRRLLNVEKQANFRMDQAVSARKFAAAAFDAITAKQGLLIRDGKSAAADEMQSRIDVLKDKLDETTIAQETTTYDRNQLKDILAKITADEDAAQKNLTDAQAEATRLENAWDEGNVTYLSKTVFGKKLLELPIADAFNSPLKITNLWTEGLTMPMGSFGKVRRFDRCTTCHRGIDKSAPGSSIEPAYEPRHEVVLQVPTPAAKPERGQSLIENQELLQDVYGIILAAEGLVDKGDVTVEYVAPNSLAASAVNTSDSACAGGLIVGDVIRYVGGDRVSTPATVTQFLLADVATWGSTIEVIVERGLPEPYTSHPRLDLYVGSLSPHKMSDIGCTVCHEGQGSGTAFQFTSHTPNSVAQESEWRHKYGWSNNHHWIFPMQPDRFAESSCLKCHHDVVELGPSERFPETPAPQLVAGYNLIKSFGCFGCHEINGYKGADERIGPDLRLERNYYAAAAQLSQDADFQSLPLDHQALTQRVIQHSDDDDARHQLLAIIEADAASDTPKWSAKAHKLSELLADVEAPGKMRKVGPSLRHIAEKVGPSFLFDWIRQPNHFRPSTRMPQFFGMWDHLQDDPDSLAKSKAFEPIEILGIVTYLLDRSQPMQYIPKAERCSPADVERGKVAFETRGCLACHQHSAFDNANHGQLQAAPKLGLSRQTQGPDLSNVGSKFSPRDTPAADKWLYTWLQNPQLYHVRTKMPNLFLEPIEDAQGNRTDPAADIAAFLLNSRNDWTPQDPRLTLDEENRQNLEDLALEYLKKAFFTEQSEEYLRTGIPESLGPTLKGSEVELLRTDGSAGDLQEKMLLYVGSKSISKYGCFGCHDIPGFEAAKPIGTTLAEWGRKETSKIAFERIAEYIAHGHALAPGTKDSADDGAQGHDGSRSASQDHSPAAHTAEGGIDESFYIHRLEGHDRTGFIWQKLKEPRSYDFKKAHNKDYNERLRMPKFPLSDVQREQVITFVLGLVSEPPAHQFVYHPDERQQAIIAGKNVLNKYNCAGCHILDTERWEIEYLADDFDPPLVDVNGYPFMSTQLSAEVLTASATPDKQRGTLSATLEGMPELGEANASPVLFIYDDIDEEWYPLEEDEEFDPLAVKHSMVLWRPTAIDDNTMEVGQRLSVVVPSIKKRFLAQGGDLTLRLLPRVLEIEKQSNPAAKGTEVWGWLPPPLHEEGSKVQPEWLHSFLLDPQPIRPAVFMRMPRFNMSPAEATALVNYFAAKGNASYPYDYVERTRGGHLAQLEAEYVAQPEVAEGGSTGIKRLEDALKIVTFKDYCVTCHGVSDYQPEGSPRGLGPELANVYRRMRGDYVRNWIANPMRVLPYTPMPAVIKFQGPENELVPQTLYHGKTIEQLDAVVDLLMNFDRYAAGQSSIAPMIAKPTTTATAGSAPTATDQASINSEN